MSALKIAGHCRDAGTDRRIKQEMLAKRLARIKPMPRDGITEAW
jgi:hypothetical protein